MMNWFINRRVFHKLLLQTGVLFTLMLGIWYAADYGFKTLFDQIMIFSESRLPAIDYLLNADRDLQQALVSERTLFITPLAAPEFSALLNDFHENVKQTNERVGKYGALATEEAEKRKLAEFFSKMKEWENISGEIIAQIKTGKWNYNTEQAKKTMALESAAFEAARGVVDQLQDLVWDMVKVSRDQSKELENKLDYLIKILLGLALIIGMGLIALINNSLSKPLSRVTDICEKIALGCLDVEFEAGEIRRKDEIGLLANSMNRMTEGLKHNAGAADKIASGDLTVKLKLASERDQLGLALRGMVAQMSDSLSVIGKIADEVEQGSEQLAAASQSLSQGSTEQAASLQEITSSMVEIASQSKANAENAGQASLVAGEARRAGESSKLKMQDMVRAVSEISNSSQQIAKIIKVIDEIAFQTNLLALNAAVEAARAGKHGKGFAVVAEEVRNLAARSARAARETAELIEDSVKKVEDGTIIASETAGSLEQIVNGAAKVADYLAEISAASNEQALGVEQINVGLSQVDKVTQAMSANAEETAAASEELSSQAQELVRVLSHFQFDEKSSGVTDKNHRRIELLEMV